MNDQLDRLDFELSGTDDLAQVKRYAAERVQARYAFIRVLENLEPPADVSDLRDAALGIMGRVADAESALADYVMELDSLAAVGDFWATPLGAAARSVDAEAIELCLEAQDELDTTERRRSVHRGGRKTAQTGAAESKRFGSGNGLRRRAVNVARIRGVAIAPQTNLEEFLQFTGNPRCVSEDLPLVPDGVDL